MANAWLLKPLPIVAAAATGTTIGEPIYVANDYAGVIWGASGAAMVGSGPYYHWLDLDLGTAQVVDTVALFGLPPSAPSDASVYVEGMTSAGSGTIWSIPPQPLYAGSVAPVSGRCVSICSSTSLKAPARYARVVIVSATRFDLQIARLVIGKRIQLERNYGFGGQFGVRDLGSVDFSRRGVMLRQRGKKLRTAALTFSNVRKDEVEAQTKPLMEQIGNTEPVALCTDPAEHPQRQNRCYFGPLVGDLGHTQRNSVGWEAKINVVSLF